MPGPWVWDLEHVYESINYIIILHGCKHSEFSVSQSDKHIKWA